MRLLIWVKRSLVACAVIGFAVATHAGANAVWSPNGLQDAFVGPLVIDPTNTSTLYAGGAGDAFKSTDGGANWVGINNGLTNTEVFALAIDPTKTSTLYAAADGVFASSDGGVNWTPIRTGLTDLVLVGVSTLLIDPNTSTFYAGTFDGVFVFVLEPLWLYGPGKPAGMEAGFNGLALANFTNLLATADLLAVTSRSKIASLQARSPQGNGNRATVMLQIGEQTALLRAGLFEGDPDEPAWIGLTSFTNEIGTFF